MELGIQQILTAQFEESKAGQRGGRLMPCLGSTLEWRFIWITAVFGGACWWQLVLASQAPSYVAATPSCPS